METTIQNQTETIKIGDIFTTSWGYDQTNVNCFQVVKLTPKGVFIREIAKKATDQTGFMSGNVIPIKDDFIKNSVFTGENNPPTFKRVNPKYNTFKFESRYICSKWDNQPLYTSWYA